MFVFPMLFIVVFFSLMLLTFSVLLNVAVIRVLVRKIDAVDETSYLIDAAFDFPNIGLSLSKNALVFSMFPVAMFVVMVVFAMLFIVMLVITMFLIVMLFIIMTAVFVSVYRNTKDRFSSAE